MALLMLQAFSLFKGLTPPLIGVVFIHSSVFGSNAIAQAILGKRDGVPLTLTEIYLSGVLAGSVQALFSFRLSVAPS
jgi:hypothetical protein